MSHIAIGGGWSTALTIVNLWSAPSSVEIRFYDDNGMPLAVNTNTAQGTTALYRSTLDVRNSQRVLLTGGADVRSGWAEISYDWSDAVVGFSAVFRLSIAGRPDFEAFSPVLTPYMAVRVPFDETGGFSTGVAICNPNNVPDSYEITVYDETGKKLNATPVLINLSPKGHTAFALTSNPQLKDFVTNQKGVMDINSHTDRPVGVLGLRFSPTGSFSTVMPWDLNWGN